MRLILYSTAGCHLCEEAEQLLRSLQPEYPRLAWDVVDIADDDVLFERYGWVIPVLRFAAAGESAASRPAGEAHVEGKDAAAAAIEAQPGEGPVELHWPFDCETLESAIKRATGRSVA